jgi:hypothetical protein
MEFRGKQSEFFDGSNLSMRGTTLAEQFPVGYTAFNINWDNLSSEDQDIADALTAQTGDVNTSTEVTPQIAQIQTPAPRRPSFVAANTYLEDALDEIEAGPTPPPIIPVGTKPVLPLWKDLTEEQLKRLSEVYGINTMEQYNEELYDPATAAELAQDLGCRGAM